jgi:endoglucanase
MVFRGLVSFDPVIMDMGNPVDPRFTEDYFHAMAGWGANVIRVPIQPFSLHSKGLSAALRYLDQTIEWAGKYRMYVIIDFQSAGWFPDDWFDSEGARTTLEEWKGFWKAVSSRYADNDVVAFYELFNEPAEHNHWPYVRKEWLTWKSIVEPLINDVVRPNDPEKIVLVGGIQSSFNLSYAAGAPIVDRSGNVAYAVHPYTNWKAPGWDAAFGDLSRRYPVFATELGYQDDTEFKNILIGGVPYRQAIIDYLEKRGMSWTVWGFSANWPTVLLKSNTTYEPIDAGVYFRGRLLELNGKPSFD